jgi:hypothetical protein
MDEQATQEPVITAPAGFVPPPMPAEIAKAVVKVMTGVNKLAKDGTNAQGGYAYTSVDAFFEMIRPLMAEAAIFDMLFEISSKTVSRVGNYEKKSNWLECEFDIYFYHESGVSFGPIRRNIQVIASGPQANASAQSFVEKAILRSLFKIATGDIDPDQHPPVELPTKDDRPPRDIHADKREETRRKIDSVEYVGEAIDALKKIKTRAELTAWWKAENPNRNEYFTSKDDPLYVELRTTCTEHGDTLPSEDAPKAEAPTEPTKTPAEKLTQDSIPY